MTPCLAATDAENLLTLAAWGLAIMLAFVALAIAIYVFRKRVRGRDKRDAMGWDLDTLAELHRCGDLTDREFRTLRQKAIQRMAESFSSSGRSENQ